MLILLLTVFYFYLNQDFKKNPSTLYINGNIITLDDNLSIAQAMFVKNGKIQNLGSTKELFKFSTKKTETIDLKGATVLPGFIDPHTHFNLSMFMENMIDLSGFKHKTNKEVWSYFETETAKIAQGKWIICKGIDPILVSNLKTPSIAYLDSIAPNNPVIMFSQSLHSYWANTMTFKKAGITKQTPNPSEHSFYGKDEKGELTGLIAEQEAIFPILKIVKEEALTPKILGNIASKIMTDYAKNGNTTIVSAGLTINDSKPLILMKHLSNEKSTLLGNLLQKIGKFPKRKAAPRHFIYMRYNMAHLLPENKIENDFYNIIGVKHWYDGAPYIGSMYLNEPYLNTKLTREELNIVPNSRGKALIKKDDFKNFIKNTHNKGWQIAIHAQGDAANKEIIDMFQELDSELDYTNSRHRLEHCLLLDTIDIKRMKKLNISPSFHINHLYYYGDALKSNLLGEERVKRILPVGFAHKNGLIYSFHADQPMFESKPFRLIQTAIERQTKTKDTIAFNEKVTLTQALKAMTINAAWQINMENKIGSLEKGKYADFIILDKNPYKTPINELENIKCLQTYINGNLIE